MAQEVIEVTQREVEIIEVIERGPVGPTGPQPDINYEVVSSARTLEAADLIAADTSGGAFTLTLPANPSNGDAVDIFDFSETFDTNPLTIARNGQPIESLNEDLVANVEGAYFTLIYTGATRGWQVLPRYGGGGGSGGELTTEGDILYRGPAVNTRLGIGTAGQILKVNSTATAPEWGAAPDSIDDYTVVTTSQTLTNGARIAADTTGGSFTLTLPATPAGGDTVYILDYAQTFDTNNLILARNGSNIEGLAEDMTCNVEGSSFKMVYTGASTGWQMIPYYGTGVAIGSNATDVLSLSSGEIVADDPAADRLVFWDDSESKLTYLQAGSGLTISGTTISASGGDTVTIDASAADILSATSGAISADDAGSDKIVFWDDSESKLAYGSVGDVGAAAASHTHDASAITSGTLNNDRVNFAAPPAIGNTTPNSGVFTTLNATGTTELVNATNAAGPFRVYNTSSSANANYERGFMRWSSNNFEIGTEKAGTGSGRNLELVVDGTTRMIIDTSGQVGIGNGVSLNRPFHIYGTAAWGRIDRVGTVGPAWLMVRMSTGQTVASSWLFGPLAAAGSTVAGSTDDDFTISDFGTAISGVAGTARLTISKSTGQLTVNGNLNLSTKDLVTDTTTGTKIGTGTTQKIGFFNATPVVQQAAIADAIDAATTQARLNDLLAAMRSLGLIAT